MIRQPRHAACHSGVLPVRVAITLLPHTAISLLSRFSRCQRLEEYCLIHTQSFLHLGHGGLYCRRTAHLYDVRPLAAVPWVRSLVSVARIAPWARYAALSQLVPVGFVTMHSPIRSNQYGRCLSSRRTARLCCPDESCLMRFEQQSLRPRRAPFHTVHSCGRLR